MVGENKNNSMQMEIVSIEDLVPKDHLLRKIEAAIDWNFIYDLVEDKYCHDNGRPSINPVNPRLFHQFWLLSLIFLIFSVYH